VSEPVEKHYARSELTLVWRPALCVHARKCFTGLPSVFDPAKRPWIRIDGATADAIAAQVRLCPSGALSLLGDAPRQTTEPRVTTAPRLTTEPPRTTTRAVRREQLIHRLHEAAELEHSLMCTYLYAAFSLKQGDAEGLTPEEAAATTRWRRMIIDIAIEEMGHLAAVWNITSAIGGSPRFGRANFPIGAGLLPAAVVVKLAPFDETTIQHFVHLERPAGSTEPDGAGFSAELAFVRGAKRDRLTPMAFDYATVGELYSTIEAELRTFVAEHGERVTFCGDPSLQLGPTEVALDGATIVTSLDSALASLTAIVEQGEGSPPRSGDSHPGDSHFARFATIRAELAALRAARPGFSPAFPAATNPVLRTPLTPAGRVWIEHEEAATTVDVANASYALMLRLLAYAYILPRGKEKGLVVSLALELMRAVTLLGERAARLPAGPSHEGVNAGMSFTALRDTAPLPPGAPAHRYFTERLCEIATATAALQGTDPRTTAAAERMVGLTLRAEAGFSVPDDSA
jgi:uncharacterized Fe-S cluster protein YjdI